MNTEEIGKEPNTPDELHAWLLRVLGLRVPRRGLIDGHASPMDYLAWSFLGGDDSPPDAVVWANRGGGKTFLGAVATALDLIFRPGIEVRVLGGSLDQSKRMHAHLRRLFDPRRSEALAALVDGKITERRLALRNGSEVEMLAQSQTSVRGTRVQKLRCDEVDLFDPDVWEAAQLTTRSATLTLEGGGTRHVRGSIECLSTMHIPHGVMHQLVQEARAGSRALFRWGVVDVLESCPEGQRCAGPGEGPANTPPAHDESPDACPLWAECRGRAKKRPPERAGHVTVRDAVSLKRRVSEATWEAEMLCRRPRRSAQVLPEFEPPVHVFGGPGAPDHAEVLRGLPGVRWLAGMDFGMRSPTVVLWAALDEAGTLWIVDERHVADVVLDEHVGAIVKGLERPGVAPWPRPEWIGIDPAGFSTNDHSGQSSAGVLKHAGLVVRGARASIQAGLQLVRARLRPASGGPRVFVHARCVKLIESMEKHHYDPREPESDTPVKGQWDHSVDALRYLILNLDRPVRVSVRTL